MRRGLSLGLAFAPLPVILFAALLTVSCHRPDDEGSSTGNPYDLPEDGIYTAYQQIHLIEDIAAELQPYLDSSRMDSLTTVYEIDTATSSDIVVVITVSDGPEELAKMSVRHDGEGLVSDLIFLKGRLRLHSVIPRLQVFQDELEDLQEQFFPDLSGPEYLREEALVRNRHITTEIYLEQAEKVQSYLMWQALWSNTKVYNPQSGIYEYTEVWVCGPVIWFYKEDYTLAFGNLFPELPFNLPLGAQL